MATAANIQNSPLTIRSGEVRLGETGIPTGAVDLHDKPLFTGDIVLTFTTRGDESYDYISNLSVVVPNRDAGQPDEPDFFVMGIKSVPMDEPGEWRVLKVKDHSDVVEGEHWPAWGFSFGAADRKSA